MTDKKQGFGTLAALAANIIFGFSFIFSKAALTVAHPLIILCVRFIVAFATLNLLLLTGKIKISLRGKPKKRLFLMALAQPLFYFVFELYGLRLVSSALSGVIIALVPVAVTGLSAVFLKEKATAAQTACSLVSLVGICTVSILSNDGSKNHFVGILLLIAAVISAAVFNILSRSESKIYSPFERTYCMFFIGSVGFTVLAATVLRNRFLPLLFAAVSSPVFWVSIFYLAVLSSVAAFLLYNYSTTVISAVRSSSFSNMITVVTVAAGVLILKEHFSAAEYILCAVITAGVWGVNTFTGEKHGET